MKVIALNGSPRAGGNTESLLKKVLEPISAAGIETKLIHIGGQALRGCTACYKCVENKDRRCIINSDRMNEYIAEILESDAIILGSPSYFADVTSEMKALIDRVGMVTRANGGLLSRKIGAAVVANRRGGAMHVFDSMNHLFLMSRMIVPGSTYWNFGVGRNKGDVEEDTEAMDNMKDLGETIAWLCGKIIAE